MIGNSYTLLALILIKACSISERLYLMRFPSRYGLRIFFLFQSESVTKDTFSISAVSCRVRYSGGVMGWKFWARDLISALTSVRVRSLNSSGEIPNTWVILLCSILILFDR